MNPLKLCSHITVRRERIQSTWQGRYHFFIFIIFITVYKYMIHSVPVQKRTLYNVTFNHSFSTKWPITKVYSHILSKHNYIFIWKILRVLIQRRELQIPHNKDFFIYLSCFIQQKLNQKLSFLSWITCKWSTQKLCN